MPPSHAAKTRAGSLHRRHHLRSLRRSVSRVIAALTEPASIRRFLQGVGLPAQPPPIVPPRAPPQTELEFRAG